ncbi:MAG: hypothetical protein ABW061_21795 [Polyangiaceae bacterium]
MGRILIWVATLVGLVLATRSAHASPNPEGFWFSLSAEYRVGTWQRQWSAFLALNVPLERLAAPRFMRDAPRLAEEPPKKTSTPAPANEPVPVAPAPVPRPVSDSTPPAVGLTPRLARGAIRHALREAGYIDTRTRLSSIAARARSSAALPEVGLRTLHSSGTTLRLTPTNDDPYRYTQAGTSELSLEARLTWHLDRLVFADEEVPVERLQHERDAAERRLIDFVLQRLIAWQRGRVRAADLNLDPEQRQSAELEALGAAVELDVLTGGWFSWAIGETVAQGAGDAGESAKVEVNTPRHAR